jgi:hypothetical protein
VDLRLGEEEREARLLWEILRTVEEIRDRLPKPPTYQPTKAIVVIANPPPAAAPRGTKQR